jgi:hypothetical protein
VVKPGEDPMDKERVFANICNLKISRTWKFVLLVYANHFSLVSFYLPQDELIAKSTGLSRRTVRRVTQQLIDAGYFKFLWIDTHRPFYRLSIPGDR